MAENIIGCFEKVSFPGLGISAAIAKIDTGAFSGAIHAKNIRTFTQNGKKVLQFSRFDKPSERFTTDSFYVRNVRSASGHRARRYVVRTKIIINKKEFDVVIGLGDRSAMKYDVLIGRQFLRENNILVDVTKNQELDADLKIWNKIIQKKGAL